MLPSSDKLLKIVEVCAVTAMFISAIAIGMLLYSLTNVTNVNDYFNTTSLKY